MTGEQAVPLTLWNDEQRAAFREKAYHPGTTSISQALARHVADQLDAYAEAYKAGRDDPERAAVAGKTAQAVDREGGATTPAHAQDPDSAEHVHPGGFTGRHQHGGWHRHEVSDREAYKAGRDGLDVAWAAVERSLPKGSPEWEALIHAAVLAGRAALATRPDTPKEPTP